MRYLLTTLVIVMLLAMSVSGQGMESVKDKMMVSAYGGYALGFGDAFKDFEGPGYKIETSAGIGFGAMFHYGLTEKLLLGGELGWQHYGADVSYDAGDFGSYSGSSGSTEMNILANVLYAMQYEEEKAFYLNFGGGLYGGDDSNFGIFGGILYSKKFGDKISGFVAPRFHMVLSDPSAMMLQICVGASMPIGNY